MKIFRLLVIFLFSTLALTSCGSSTSADSFSKPNQTNLPPSYVQSWKKSCTEDSLSEECTKYVRDMRVSDYLLGTNSGDKNQLIADFDGAKWTDNLGRIYCIDGKCIADLIISNYGNSAWDDSLKVQLLDKKNTYDATENVYFDPPLNPGLDESVMVVFNVGRNMDNMEQLWIRSKYTEGLEATIQLCKIDEESQTKEFSGFSYENCLRLKHFTFSKKGFVPKTKI